MPLIMSEFLDDYSLSNYSDKLRMKTAEKITKPKGELQQTTPIPMKSPRYH